MEIDFKSFDKKQCQKILTSIVENKKHRNTKKTMSFLLKLNKIELEDIELILSSAEKYYFYIKNYFDLDDNEKLIFAASKITEFKKSELSCCIQVFNSDSIPEVLKHMLSVEHFLEKELLEQKLKKDITMLIDYFKATNNTNTQELLLIHRLIKENKTFHTLVIKEKNG